MKIFPAIDLSGGRVVRLTRGDYKQMTVYANDPVAAAQAFEKAGAKYLHVVDLDGAKDGSAANFEAVESIVQNCGLFVEVGGGIRTEERIRQYLDMGVGRVILGTVAVKNFEFAAQMIAEYGDKIAVSVDARAGRVAVNGWLEDTELETEDFCRLLFAVGVQTVIVTDIDRDGVQGGANLQLYAGLRNIEGLKLVASGGISFAEEIDRLAAIGVDGVIIGKALYSGRLELADCLRRAEEAAR